MSATRHKAVAIAALFLIGCSTSSRPDDIVLRLEPSGKIDFEGFSLQPHDFPDFAKQVGSKQVVLVPTTVNGQSVDYSMAARTREQLTNAGVKNVMIGAD